MTHIAIAGAGIAGLSSAILLAQQGKHISVFEQVIDPTPVGAGLLLQPSGQAVLRQLGLLDAVREKAAVVESLQGYSGRWKTLDLHYRFAQADWYGLGIHRANLHRILWQEAQNCGVTLHSGNGIQHFEQVPHGVLLHHQQGTLSCDALVVANGTHSQLRGQLPVKQQHHAYPWGAYWAVLDRDDWPFPAVLMQRYRGARIMLGILPTGINPLTHKRCYSLFWSLPRTAFAAYQDEGMPGLITRIRAIWPEVADWLGSAPDTTIAIAEYADVRMQTFNHQHVAVIGDAAHAMSPQLGQGANMALIDATVLAQCLSPCGAQDPLIPAALQSYSQRRAKHIAYYQMTSRVMTPLYQSHYPVGWLRDLGTVAGRSLSPVYRQYLLTLCGAKKGTWDMAARIEDLF